MWRQYYYQVIVIVYENSFQYDFSLNNVMFGVYVLVLVIIQYGKIVWK